MFDGHLPVDAPFDSDEFMMLLNQGRECFEAEDYAGAAAVYEAFGKKFTHADIPDPDELVFVAYALFFKGLSHERLGQTDLAFGCYEAVLARFAGSPEPQLQHQVAEALYRKAKLLAEHRGDLDGGIGLFLELFRRFHDYPFEQCRLLSAHAMLDVATLLRDNDQAAGAEKAYRLLASAFPRPADADLALVVARGLAGYAEMLAGMGRAEQAREQADRLLELVDGAERREIARLYERVNAMFGA
jgi:tetratricopeptide (TPR) repeat protein